MPVLADKVSHWGSTFSPALEPRVSAWRSGSWRNFKSSLRHGWREIDPDGGRQGVPMKAFSRITILTIVVFLLASVHARAQGPAGAGAAAAAGRGSSSPSPSPTPQALIVQ